MPKPGILGQNAQCTLIALNFIISVLLLGSEIDTEKINNLLIKIAILTFNVDHG